MRIYLLDVMGSVTVALHGWMISPFLPLPVYVSKQTRWWRLLAACWLKQGHHQHCDTPGPQMALFGSLSRNVVDFFPGNESRARACFPSKTESGLIMQHSACSVCAVTHLAITVAASATKHHIAITNPLLNYHHQVILQWHQLPRCSMELYFI